MRLINDYNKFVNENIQATQMQLSQESIIKNKVNKIVDYTLIRPGTIMKKVTDSIKEAIEYGYYGIVVNPELVNHASSVIEDGDLKIISTLDFPDGNMRDVEKLTETVKILNDGADEIDMVININNFRKIYSQQDKSIRKSAYLSMENNIQEIANECHKNGKLLKVVVESGILSAEELKDMCTIVSNGNVDFVQTSAGMESIGADLEKVKLLRRLLPDYIKIKASGGIRSLEDANNFFPYVDRIGTSSILK